MIKTESIKFFYFNLFGIYFDEKYNFKFYFIKMGFNYKNKRKDFVLVELYITNWIKTITLFNIKLYNKKGVLNLDEYIEKYLYLSILNFSFSKSFSIYDDNTQSDIYKNILIRYFEIIVNDYEFGFVYDNAFGFYLI